jgi:hypothetical protein
MLRGAHERKKTKLTIINLLFVFFLLTSFLFMIFLESCHDTFLDEIIILVNNRPTLRLGIRYWMIKQTNLAVGLTIPVLKLFSAKFYQLGSRR